MLRVSVHTVTDTQTHITQSMLMMPLKLLTRSHPAPQVLTLQIWKSIDANRSQEKRSTVTDYARGNRWLNLTLVRLEEVATSLPIGSNKQNLRLIEGLRRSHRLSQDERITGDVTRHIMTTALKVLCQENICLLWGYFCSIWIVIRKKIITSLFHPGKGEDWK